MTLRLGLSSPLHALGLSFPPNLTLTIFQNPSPNSLGLPNAPGGWALKQEAVIFFSSHSHLSTQSLGCKFSHLCHNWCPISNHIIPRSPIVQSWPCSVSLTCAADHCSPLSGPQQSILHIAANSPNPPAPFPEHSCVLQTSLPALCSPSFPHRPCGKGCWRGLG